MTEYPVHGRLFKVSRERNQLDLLCEQHKRHIKHRNGLPEWQEPCTPAGKSSSCHVRTPAFFAWEQERPAVTWQTETPQKVARTLEMESEVDVMPEESSHTYSSEERLEPVLVGDGQQEDTAIEVNNCDDRVVEEGPHVMAGRCITVSPMRQDILDRLPPPATVAVPSQTPTPLPIAEVSPSPYRPTPSPTYRHDRRFEENNVAMPSSRTQSCAAGITTEQADRYRMSKSSGKRLRSPAKQTILWGDPCHNYVHQSGASVNADMPSVSHKRQVRSAAERTFGGSSVFRTLIMDTSSWPPSEVERGQHRPVVTDSDAINVAKQAVHKFPGKHEEVGQQAELASRQAHARYHNMDNNSFGSIPIDAAAFRAPTAGHQNYRKTKKVSFGANDLASFPNEGAVYSQPWTLPVLADKTTQTDAFLLPTQTPSRPDRLGTSDCREAQRNDHGSPLRCSACNTTRDDLERPQKIPRGSAESVGATLPYQHGYRRTSSHLTNPIMINPRYPLQTTTFQGKPMGSTISNDRVPWR